MAATPTDNIVLHRFPTISDHADWFEIALRNGRDVVYITRTRTMWAETDVPTDSVLSERIHRYIEMARTQEASEGDAINDLPVTEARRVLVHPPQP